MILLIDKNKTKAVNMQLVAAASIVESVNEHNQSKLWSIMFDLSDARQISTDFFISKTAALITFNTILTEKDTRGVHDIKTFDATEESQQELVAEFEKIRAEKAAKKAAQEAEDIEARNKLKYGS